MGREGKYMFLTSGEDQLCPLHNLWGQGQKAAENQK